MQGQGQSSPLPGPALLTVPTCLVSLLCSVSPALDPLVCSHPRRGALGARVTEKDLSCETPGHSGTMQPRWPQTLEVGSETLITSQWSLVDCQEAWKKRGLPRAAYKCAFVIHVIHTHVYAQVRKSIFEPPWSCELICDKFRLLELKQLRNFSAI